jgi:hypothetical protein
MNEPRPIPYRLNLMLAIQRAQDGGLPHFAAALADMLRADVRGYSIPTFDRVNHDQNHGQSRHTTAGR